MNHVETNQLQRLRTMHLFAGAGGGILADLLLGHQPVCAVEIDPYCQQVLEARQRDCVLPWFPIFGEIREFDGNPWRGVVDAIHAGIPCQRVSAAGCGLGFLDQDYYAAFVRIVREVGPEYVLVENSSRLTGRGLHGVLWDLASMGYDAKWGVLGADAVGLPHHRTRLWLVAHTASRRCESHDQQRFSKPKDALTRCPVQDWERRKAESGICRDGDGLANRLDRLRAIGNGQVPLVAATAWRILIEQLCAGTSG